MKKTEKPAASREPRSEITQPGRTAPRNGSAGRDYRVSRASRGSRASGEGRCVAQEVIIVRPSSLRPETGGPGPGGPGRRLLQQGLRGHSSKGFTPSQARFRPIITVLT